MTQQQQCELEKAQAQIKELEKTIKRIHEEADKPKKWEPKEGECHLYGYFGVGFRPNEPYVEAGMGSYTKEQAKVVAKELREAARMWAYKMEFDADFVPDWGDRNQTKYYPYYDCEEWLTVYSAVTGSRQGLPDFSKQACEELVDKLNSGEVEF